MIYFFNKTSSRFHLRLLPISYFRLTAGFSQLKTDCALQRSLGLSAARLFAPHFSLVSNLGCLSGGRKSNEDALKERRRVSALFSMMEPSLLQFYVSRQWLNKFKTFAEPGPISNSDFLCSHGGAYDSFHSEHHGAGSPVSFPSFLPCAACLQTPLFMAAVELPTVSYTVQGQTSKGVGGGFTRLCAEDPPLLLWWRRGRNLKSGRASQAPLFSASLGRERWR